MSNKLSIAQILSGRSSAPTGETARQRLIETAVAPETKAASTVSPVMTMPALAPPAVSILTPAFNLTNAVIESDEDVEIYGSFEGKLTCRTLVIHPGARVVGEIVFQTGEIHGHLEGTTRGTSARLFKTANLVGHLSCVTVAMQFGCSLKANIESERNEDMPITVTATATVAQPPRYAPGAALRQSSPQIDSDFDGNVIRFGN